MEGAWYTVAVLGQGLFGKWKAEEHLEVINRDRKNAFWNLCLQHHFPDETHEKIVDFYFGDHDLTNSPRDKIVFSQMVGDLLFNYESFYAAYLHSRVDGAAPVYQYRQKHNFPYFILNKFKTITLKMN